MSPPSKQVPNHGTPSAKNTHASTPSHLLPGRPNNGPSAAGPGKAHREMGKPMTTVRDTDRDGR